MATVDVTTADAPGGAAGRHEIDRFLPLTVAVAGIWVAVAAISIFSPAMVTGAAQEQLPIAAMATWLWGVIATGFVMFGAASAGGSRSTRRGLPLAVVAIWFAVTTASVLAPGIVTGSDPTTIPIAAILGPIVGAFATGFV